MDDRRHQAGPVGTDGRTGSGNARAGSGRLGVSIYFGGTSLLIVVGVAMDTVQQIEVQLMMRHYEGFVKKGRLRGRRG